MEAMKLTIGDVKARAWWRLPTVSAAANWQLSGVHRSCR
jgi:hypothetical protein